MKIWEACAETDEGFVFRYGITKRRALELVKSAAPNWSDLSVTELTKPNGRDGAVELANRAARLSAPIN